MIAWQLLGPTGVGKSYWAQQLASETERFVFADLDELIAPESQSAASFLREYGWACFAKRSEQALLSLASDPDHVYLVAIGAGTQMAAVLTEQGLDLFKHPTLTLWCEPTSLLRRLRFFRQDTRTLEALLAVEFNAERTQIYRRAQAFLDVTKLSEQQCRSALKALMCSSEQDS